MALLILYVLLALAVSFACSIMEAVLLSVTPAYVGAREAAGDRVARRLRQLKQDIDRPLAAILSLNTIAHTVGAAGAGAQAAAVFGSGAVGVFSAVLTLLILVLSEIIPKTIGAIHWKRLVPLVVRVLPFLTAALWPLVAMASWLRRLLTPSGDPPVISRDEIAAMAEEGRREGVVGEDESRVLRNLMRLQGLTAADVMTPASSTVMAPAQATVHEFLRRYPELRFSRIPIYTRRPEDAVAFVLKDDILGRVAADHHGARLAELRRQALVVTPDLPLPELFEQMLDGQHHIALVRAEGEGLGGIVTMEDLIETLLGLEIVDEADSPVELQARARQRWRERARKRGIVIEEPERRPTGDAA